MIPASGQITIPTQIRKWISGGCWQTLHSYFWHRLKMILIVWDLLWFLFFGESKVSKQLDISVWILLQFVMLGSYLQHEWEGIGHVDFCIIYICNHVICLKKQLLLVAADDAPQDYHYTSMIPDDGLGSSSRIGWPINCPLYMGSSLWSIIYLSIWSAYFFIEEHQDKQCMFLLINSSTHFGLLHWGWGKPLKQFNSKIQENFKNFNLLWRFIVLSIIMT